MSRLASQPPAAACSPAPRGRSTGSRDIAPDLIELRFHVDPRYDGWRLDHFIRARVPRLSRTRIQQMIRSQPALGGPAVRPASRVRGEQVVVLRRPAPDEPDVPRRFEVLHDDGQLMALAKPAGLPVHATARYHRNTLVALLRERFAGREPTPALAHRLDRETSGLMLLGCTREAGAALKLAFRRRQVHKRYLAIVRGPPPADTVLDMPLGPDTASGIRVKMAAVPGGLPARTRVRTLERRGEHALVEACPETGRQHQIRVHLAAAGCPVVGDKLYGPDPRCLLEFVETGWTESLRRRLLLPRQALHAAGVTFPHPATGERTRLGCPLPADLQAFWDRCDRGEEEAAAAAAAVAANGSGAA
jgi:23S rRNA pseudouridine1911/1915/1917 synthase